jgi:hypothetical protein
VDGTGTEAGFCTLEVNPFGPTQLNVAPATLVAVRLNVGVPSQTSPLFPAVIVHPPQDVTVMMAVAEVGDGHSGFPPEEFTV